MPLPELTSREDKSVLKHEPLCGNFGARIFLPNGKRKSRGGMGEAVGEIDEALAKELLELEEWRPIIKQWVALAFAFSPKENKKVQKQFIKIHDNPPLEFAAIFVHFFWLLHSEVTPKHRDFLRARRTACGFQHGPDCNTQSRPKPVCKRAPKSSKAGTSQTTRVPKRPAKRERRSSSPDIPLIQLSRRIKRDPDAVASSARGASPPPNNFPAQTSISLPSRNTPPVFGIPVQYRSPVLNVPAMPQTAPLVPTLPSRMHVKTEWVEPLVGATIPCPKIDDAFALQAPGAPLPHPNFNWNAGLPPADFVPVPPPPPKQPLWRYPPIWAQSRQEVCESFEWFRSYQGGVYYVNNIVKGYLLSAFNAKRDASFHDGKLIISHGGGKAESIHFGGGTTHTEAASDQELEDKSVRALINNYERGIPLVLVIDDKYVNFPYSLASKNVVYAVLGLYTISHAWAEYEPAPSAPSGRVVRWKFAFRWCEDQGVPWWIPPPVSEMHDGTSSPGSTTSDEFRPNRVLPTLVQQATFQRPYEDPRLYRHCECCRKTSPQVFAMPWACLNPVCSWFWFSLGGFLLPLDHMDLNGRMLELEPSNPLPAEFKDINPPPPITSDEGHPSTTTFVFSRGWHCRNCGRLSCRFKWECWECANCATRIVIEHSIVRAADCWNRSCGRSFPAGHDFEIDPSSGIQPIPKTRVYSENGVTLGVVHTFTLPMNRGKIHQIQSQSRAREEANALFIKYQEEASDGRLQFKRWPLRAHKLRGPLLTNYFSQNTGEPYQYVGGTENTVPMSEAPEAVIGARKLIHDRLRQAVGIDVQFNEILSAAYMERQKMAFHSDAEKGLGPVIAGLSLGSPALMHFRLHSKYDPDPTQPRRIAMTFKLSHGDVLVMEGAAVQIFYEHTLVPANFRISATARCISSVLATGSALPS